MPFYWITKLPSVKYSNSLLHFLGETPKLLYVFGYSLTYPFVVVKFCTTQGYFGKHSTRLQLFFAYKDWQGGFFLTYLT